MNVAMLHMNPDQVPVIAMGQPLYSMAKQIQRPWPDTMGENKYIVMLGGLHTEKVVPNILGEWLDGSGWATALMEASIPQLVRLGHYYLPLMSQTLQLCAPSDSGSITRICIRGICYKCYK